MKIGRKSPGSLAPGFFEMKIVLEIVRYSGFPRQRMRLHIIMRTPCGMALSWRAVRPTRPGDTSRNGLAALTFSDVIGCQTSPTDIFRLCVCCCLGKDVGPVGHNDVSG